MLIEWIRLEGRPVPISEWMVKLPFTGVEMLRVPVERDAEPVRIKTYCEMQHEVTVSSSSPDFI